MGSCKYVDFVIHFQTICNYNCIFCNNDKVEHKILKSTAIRNFSSLLQHAKSVDITGYGEPTLNPEFEKIINELNRHKVLRKLS